MPFFSARTLCPNCAGPIGKGDTNCDHCGCELNPSDLPSPDGGTRHRGGRIIALGAVSLLLLPLVSVGFSCAGFLRFTLPDALPWLACGLVALVLGQSFGIFGLVLACRDWLGMKAGRVDPQGWRLSVFGGSLAALSVLMYWMMIGTFVARQL